MHFRRKRFLPAAKPIWWRWRGVCCSTRAGPGTRQKRWAKRQPSRRNMHVPAPLCGESRFPEIRPKRRTDRTRRCRAGYTRRCHQPDGSGVFPNVEDWLFVHSQMPVGAKCEIGRRLMPYSRRSLGTQASRQCQQLICCKRRPQEQCRPDNPHITHPRDGLTAAGMRCGFKLLIHAIVPHFCPQTDRQVSRFPKRMHDMIVLSVSTIAYLWLIKG